MAGFNARSSRIGNNRSTNWVTTTARPASECFTSKIILFYFILLTKEVEKSKNDFEKKFFFQKMHFSKFPSILTFLKSWKWTKIKSFQTFLTTSFYPCYKVSRRRSRKLLTSVFWSNKWHLLKGKYSLR